MATYTVTTANDELDDIDTLGTVSIANFGGIGDISLREAIALANANAGADTITFASEIGEAFNNGGTVRLTEGELILTSDITIDGDLDNDGAPDVTISGDANGDDATTTDIGGNTISDIGLTLFNGTGTDNSGVIIINSGTSVLEGLVITGGYALDGGGIYIASGANVSLVSSSISGNRAGDPFTGGYGGGILNDGTLALTNSEISNNFSSYVGGGLFEDGSTTITDSTFSDNVAVDDGGGIAATTDSILMISNSRFFDNRAGDDGGAISNYGELTGTNISVFNNSADDDGGGIGHFSHTGSLILINATLSGNYSGEDGGGLDNEGDATLINSTISGNYAGYEGGGIYTDGGARTTIQNTIIAGNEGGIIGDDVSGAPLGILSLDGTNILGTTPIGFDASPPDISGTIILGQGNTFTLANIFAGVTTNTNTGVAGGMLSDNGGSIETIALLDALDNPALDAGGTPSGVSTDAIGNARAIDQLAIDNGGLVDLGAVEIQDMINAPPVAEDDAFTIAENGMATGNLLLDDNGSGADSDLNGDTLSIVALNGEALISGANILLPSTGFLTVNTDGSFIFDPNDIFDFLDDGEVGTDSFTITIGDGNGGFDTSTVTITANGVDLGDQTLTGTPIAETLDGSSGNDEIFGLESNDLLIGGTGSDLLDGGAGDDTLEGGDARDTLIGGLGTDELDGGDGFDTADFSGSNRGAGIRLDGIVSFGAAVGDIITNVENAIGTAFNDIIVGSLENNEISAENGDDVIFALGGNDTLIGGAGNDTLLGQSGDDILIISTGSDMIDGGIGIDTVDLSEASRGAGIRLDGIVSFGAAVGDIITNVENVIGTAFNDIIVGSLENNEINAEDGDDVIFALGGNDTLIGGAGNDSLFGQGGDDVFVFTGNFGDDVINGFDTASSGEQIDLSAIDSIVDFEDVMTNLTELNGDTILTIDGNTITLTGISISDLSSDDFIF